MKTADKKFSEGKKTGSDNGMCVATTVNDIKCIPRGLVVEKMVSITQSGKVGPAVDFEDGNVRI